MHINFSFYAFLTGYLDVVVGVGGSARLFTFQVHNATQNAQVIIAGSTISASDPVQTGTWQHWGFDFKQSASGWLYIYRDAKPVFAITGNFSGSPALNRIALGHSWSSGYFSGYIDDFYVDDTSGELAPAVPADRRFIPLLPTASGPTMQWSPSGATTNLDCIDDLLSGSHDGLATYVSASVQDWLDLYKFQNLPANAIAASDAISSVIVVAIAQKSDAAASTQLRFAAQSTSGSTTYSSDKNLESSFALCWGRLTTYPGTGSAWSGSADVADCYFGIQARSI